MRTVSPITRPVGTRNRSQPRSDGKSIPVAATIDTTARIAKDIAAK
jgi:hypothetical protein